MPKKPSNPDYLYKLAGRIREKYGAQTDFAYAAKIPRTAVNYRLCRKTAFRTDEICLWCDLLEIRSDEIKEYFMPEWKPKADRIVPSGKARARYDPVNGRIICNAFVSEEGR